MSRAPDIAFIIAVCKGILRDTKVRRSVLFFVMLAALGMVFLGAVPLGSWLEGSPLRFLIYWGICGWLTLTALLLAIHDLLTIRRQALRERRQLKRDFLGDADDPNTRNDR